MTDALTVIMRWIHIASMATLVGGVLYGRLVLVPALAGLADDARKGLEERAAAKYRPLVMLAVAGLIISGLFRLAITPGHHRFYHMLLGFKLLLALHVFAVAFLIVQPQHPRRVRLMTGMMFSGLVIIAISAWLSRIF
jgi:uncharacterized membrane protein